MISYWKLDDDSSIYTAEDSLINSNDGKLRGGLRFVNGCESTTGWESNIGAAYVSLNTATYKQGSYAIGLIKDESNSSTDSYYFNENFSAINMENKFVNLWFYIEDQSVLSKVDRAQIYLYNITQPQVGGLGWKLIVLSHIR